MPTPSAKWTRDLYNPYRYKVGYGGRAGGKTTEFARAVVQRIVREPLRVCCARLFKGEIKESTQAAIVAQIKELGYEDAFDIQNSQINCALTGGHIFFLGWGRNISSVRSLEAVDILWIDEGQYLSQEGWEQIRPTVRKPGSEIWITFNPELSSDALWQEFCANPPPRRTFLHKVNYTENPYCSEETLDDATRDKEFYPQRYQHIWMGELNDTADDQRRVIPIGHLDYCIREEIPGVFEYPEIEWEYEWKREPVRAGFDVADEGADESSLAIRQGSVVLHISVFGEDIETSCDRVRELCKEFGVTDLWYDSVGIGTTVRDNFKHNMPCRNVVGVANNASVTGKKVKYDDKMFNPEMFFRRNAQLGWNLHMRAEQTRLDALYSNIAVDPRRQLYIPSHILDAQSKSEVTQPLWRIDETGHLRVIKKPKGSRKSPDRYDALALAFAHDSRSGIKSGGRHLIADGSDLEPKMRRVLARAAAEQERELVAA